MQSLQEERYLTRASELMMQVKMLVEEEMEPLRQLELIDNLQRLGISYHFEDKINQILNYIYQEHKYCKNYERDLYSTALEFRLLRQHQIFDCFKNDRGDFKPSLGDNTKGLLQLYEASFLLTESEKTLELAREFAANSLEKKLDDEGHGIDKIPRLNARWFIDAYGRRPDMNPIVLELAKLDFNIQTCLAEKLPFSRDRLVECYFLTIGELFQPQYGYSRIMEYISNAWISISGPVMLSHAYFLVTNPIEKEAVQSLYKYHNIVRCSSMILRLANDHRFDEMKRGDVPKSIQCYMNETGAHREEARDYVRFLIRETWKNMNEEVVADSPFPQGFVRSAVDLGRMAQYMYQHGDGHGIQYPQMKDRISSMPI
ncbi:hypothetical protein Pfo_031355 [Paulownia fortunei]|nr:hypothetical protein Pfo_031355 [Paulownia fortunei]